MRKSLFLRGIALSLLFLATQVSTKAQNSVDETESSRSLAAVDSRGKSGWMNKVIENSSVFTAVSSTGGLMNFNTDTDGDGVPDAIDIDDDNDGVLDHIESPNCFRTAAQWNNLSKSDLISVTTDLNLLAPNNNLSGLVDNLSTDAVQFVTSPAQAQLNKELFRFTFTRPINLKNIFILKSSATNIFANVTNGVIVQASTDGTNWTNVSAGLNPTNATNTTASGLSLANSNVLPITLNTGEYKYYRIYGNVAGNILSGIAKEFYFDINESTYVPSYYPLSTCTNDTDGDGKLNHLDTDSDGDGCPDAAESGSGSSITATTVAGPYGANGFADALETSTESGLYIKDYYYYIALDASKTICTDTDGDGIANFFDLDDDNDAVLDTEECNVDPNEDKTEAIFRRSQILSASFHGRITKDASGKYYVNGAAGSPTGSNLTSPLEISPANGYNYEGTIVDAKAYAVGSYVMITTKGLYAWGGYYMGSPNTSTFRQLALPDGVQANEVKSISASIGLNGANLALLLYNGTVFTRYYRTVSSTNDYFINGAGLTAYENRFTQVLTAANTPLTGISYVQVTADGAFAFNKKEKKFYTWGTTSYLGNGTAAVGRSYATEMVSPLPATVEPLWIQIANGITYFVLGSNGKVYALGNGALAGQPVSATQTTWITVKNEAGTADLEDVAFVSVQNSHASSNSVSVITNTGRLLSWGYNSSGMLGISPAQALLPTFPIGLTSTDKVLAVANGGHITPMIKEGSLICNTGHNWDGAFGDGTSLDRTTYQCFPLPFKIESPYCNPDTDGDGIPNRLDSDSDNDGCNDAIEGAGYPLGSTVPVAGSGNTAYGSNGFVNAKETATESGLFNGNYTYTFATDANNNLCLDSDNDGIQDYVDLDDDNDGVLDHIESPACYYSPTEWNNLTDKARFIKISSDLTYEAAYSIATELVDGDYTTVASQFVSAQQQQNKTIYEVTFDRPLRVSNWFIGKSSATQFLGANVMLQGSNDETTWTDLWNAAANPANLTTVKTPYGLTLANANVLGVEKNAAAYKYYRIFGTAAGTTLTGTITEFYFEVDDKYFPGAAYPKPSTCIVDTDGDGKLNHLDPDSDNDGCNDAIEGAGYPTGTTVPVAGTTTANYGANGFVNAKEAGTETGIFNGKYTYAYATTAALSICADTDGDGVANLLDIDDDNDGVLDHIESPSCFLTVADWNNLDKRVYASVSSELTTVAPYNSFDRLLNNDVSLDDVQFTSGQAQLNKTLFKVSFDRALQLNTWYITKTSATQLYGSTAASLMLQGSNDDATWTNLWTAAGNPANTATATTANGAVALSNVNVFTVATNAAAYKYYRIQGVLAATTLTGIADEFYFDINPSTYNASYYPKGGACLVDTDGDGVVNHLDTDSDGDNCSDAKESGTVTTTANTVAGPYGANGFANSLETATESGVYKTTYTYYNALDNSVESCIDTDGDGVADYFDLDDDNDGILDDVECNVIPGDISNRFKMLTAAFHGMMAQAADGYYYVAGAASMPDGLGQNTFPVKVSPENGYNFTGKPLFGQAYATNSYTLLTTDGLWMWGQSTTLSGASFSKVNLPSFIVPSQVKKMSVSGMNLTIHFLMNDGTIYAYSEKDAAFNGSGLTSTTSSFTKVVDQNGTELSKITNVISTPLGSLAFSKIDQKLYGWGDTYVGDGSAASKQNRATIISSPLPSGVKIVDIAATGTINGISYLVLGSDKRVYAIGDNAQGQLGQGNLTELKSWATVQNPAGSGPLENITYINAQYAYYGSATASAITSDSTLYSWGYNSSSTIGVPATGATYQRPSIPLGITSSDKIITTANGGHITPVFRYDGYIGSVGHNVGGSFGDGTTADRTAYEFNPFLGDVMIACNPDTDGDGIPNRIDLDSDNDNCPDASEAGSKQAAIAAGATVTTAGVVNGTYGANGFVNTLETVAESGLYVNAYTYDLAINTSINSCVDSDNDGIGDLIDIDDDNDGVFDHIESPACYLTAAEWNTNNKRKYLTVTSDLNFLPLYTEVGQVIDGVNSSSGIALAAQAQLNKSLLKIKFDRPQSIKTWHIAKTSTSQMFAGTNSLMFQGSNDNTTWKNLWTTAANPANAAVTTAGGIALTNANSFTVTANAGAYQYYRILGTVAATATSGIASEFYFDFDETQFNASYYPKPGTCTVDTDGDGKPNQLDPDSDGDGCNDAIEGAGFPIGTTVPVAGTDNTAYGANGFVNTKETAAESGVFSGSYTYLYAKQNTVNACTDTDGDGVADIFDLDDDNDGLLDSDECNISTDKTEAAYYQSTIMNASYHGIIIKSKDGKYYINGESASPTATNLLTPIELSVANGYPFEGSIVEAKGFHSGSYLMLTTKGFYAWGAEVASFTTFGPIPTGTTKFIQVPLPNGVQAADIKSFSATRGLGKGAQIAFLLHDGSVYVRNFRTLAATNDFYINGAGLTAHVNDYTQVLTAANTPLAGITHVVMNETGAFAFNKQTKKFYTWGTATYLGDGSVASGRSLATEMTSPLPAGVNPIWIQASNRTTYFVLGSDGRVYTVGEGAGGITGQGIGTDLVAWTTVKNETGTAPLENVKYIVSQNANVDFNSASAITNDGKLLSWGSNAVGMLGMNSTVDILLPKVPVGFTSSDVILAVAHGGHIVPVIKEGSLLCNSGHNANGAFGDGTTGDRSVYQCYPLAFKVENPMCNPDTDGDGIPNRLDLDSDNDGCSDAVEAYGVASAIGTDGNNTYGNGNPPAVKADGTVIAAAYPGTNSRVTTAATAPAITTQPVDQTVTLSGTPSFSIAITNGSGTPSIQWQVSTNGTDWTNITNNSIYAGATTSTLQLSNLVASLSGSRYRAVVTATDYVCPVISNVAKLGITPLVTLVNDAATTNENTPVSGNVLTNDLGSAGSTLTVNEFIINGTTYQAGQTATIPGIGTMIVNADGTYTFTPAQHYTGTVPPITYKATDANGKSDIAQLTISIVTVNDNPVATDDTKTITEDTPASGSLINNDSDPDSDPLSITQFTINGTTYTAGQTATIPNVGTVVVNADGTYTYTPVANYNGTVPTITYTLSDGRGGTDTGDLKITVTPVNDVPDAINDTATTAEDTPATGSVLTNDTDPDGNTLTVTEFTINGTTYTAGQTATIPNVGTVVVNADGTYTFAPVANYHGTVPTITYTVSDGNGGTDKATLDITVTPVNDAPDAVNDLKFTAANTTATGNVLTNDSDVEGNTLSVTQFVINGTTYTAGQTATIANVGTVVVNADGTYTFTPVADYSGTVPDITYTVSDGNGGTATAKLGITIAPAGNTPPVSANDNVSTNENTPVSGSLISNDTDAENDALTITQFTINGVSHNAGETVTIPNVGTIIVNADGTYTFTPATNYSGTVPPIEYTVTDNKSGSSTSTLNLTIIDVNNAPVAIDDTKTVAEDTPATGNVLSNDTDADGNTLTVTEFKINGTTYAAGQTASIPNVGTVVVNADGTYTFTPVPNYNGTVPVITYTVSDGNGTSDTGDLKITITPVNDAPVAVDDTKAVAEDTPATGSVLTNDTDLDGNTLTVTEFVISGTTYTAGQTATIPNVGTVVVNADGTYTFTPVANYTGTVPTITYKVSDGNGGTDTGDLKLTVTPVNDAPVAQDDSKTAPEDAPVIGELLSNDTDADGNTLSVTEFVINGVTYTAGQTATIPNVGSVIVNADGSYTFTPLPNYNGTVPAITYTVSDGNGGTDTADLTLTISPVNDKPVAVNDVVFTNANTPATGSVLTNDTDLDGNTLTVTKFVINGVTYTAGQTATIPNVGTVVVNADGTYTFTPDAAFTGAAPAITYTISDGNGGTASADLDITVRSGSNQAPVAKADVVTTPEDTPVSGSLISNDTDADSDALTVTQFTINGVNYTPGQTATIPNVGTVLVNADGTYTFTPVANYNGTVPEIGYTITDNRSGTSTSTLNITVASVNDAPDAKDDVVKTPEDKPATGTVLSNDTDLEGNSLTVTQFVVNGVTFTAGQTATIPNVGTVVINADGTYVFTPAANYTGDVPDIIYTISDGNGGTDTANLDITITPPVNDAPDAVNDTQNTPEDTPVSGNVLTNDTDVEGDHLAVTGFTINGLTYVAGQTATIPGVGTIIVNANGSYTFTPNPDYTGTVPAITYTVSDGNGGTDAADLNIKITPMVNDAPKAVDDLAFSKANTPATGSVLSNDTDIDGDKLTLTQFVINGVTYTAGQTATLPNVGTIVVNADGTYTFTPVANYSGTVPDIMYTISDGNGATASAKLSVIISPPVNSAPVAAADTKTTPEDTPVTGSVLSNDTDADSDPLKVTQFEINGITYAAGQTATIPNVGTIIVNADGTYTFTPVANYSGTVPVINYTITDTQTATATSSLTITVSPVNDAPIARDDAKTIAEDTPATGNLLTNDSDEERNTLTVTQFVVNGTTYTAGQTATIPNVGTIVVNADGTYTFTPVANFNGTVPVISYVISDGNGGTATAALNLTVTPVNDAPIAQNDAKTVAEDSPATGSVLSNDTDVDGDPLKVTGFTVNGVSYVPGQTATIPNVGTVVVNEDGTYTFTPNENYNGTVPPITYTVSDGKGEETNARLNITITAVNDDPLAVNDLVFGQANTPATGNVLSNDTDPEGNTLTVTQFVVNGTTYTAGQTATIPNVGTVVINADGTFTITPEANYSGTVPSVTYTVSDGKGGTDTADLNIKISPAGNRPPVSVNDQNTTPEDTPVTGSVISNDIDVDNDPIVVTQFEINGVTYSAGQTATIPNVGTLVINTDGTYTFTPVANYHGAVPAVTYTITDNLSGTSTSTLQLSVTSVNDIPVAQDDAKTITEDTPATGNVLNNDTDADGNKLTVTQFVINGFTYIAGQTATLPNIGTVVVNADGTYTFTPVPEYHGTVPVITYTVTDGNGGTDTGDLGITVTSVNDIPLAQNDAKTVIENTPATGNVLSNDTDADGNKLAVTEFVINGITYTAGQTASIPNVGTVVVNADGTYVFTPVAGYHGTLPTITYTVTDGNGGTDNADLTIIVTSVNDAPVALNNTAFTPVNTPATGNVLNNDKDADGDLLTVTGITINGVSYAVGQAVTIPNVGTIVVNADGTYVFTPVSGFTGAVPEITYTVSDGNGGTATAKLSLSVSPAGNQPPVSVNDAVTIPEDTPVSGNVLTNDTDPDNDAITVISFTINGVDYNAGQTATIPNIGSVVMNADGSYTFTPVANYNGIVPPISYTMTDKLSGTSTSILSITVAAVNDIPVANDDVNTFSSNQTATGDLLINDSDADGDNLTIISFSIAGETGNFVVGTPYTIAGVGTITINADGSYSFAPDNGYMGSVPVITYTVSDGNGGTDTAILTFTGDSDGDGIPDAIEKGADGNNPVDTDKDGTPDYLDLDSDNDGIPDLVEKGLDGNNPVDTDKDGTPDYLDLDSDNDGIPDTVEKGPDGTKPVDTDSDGIPDYRDLDSDADGISDKVEAGPTPATPVDTDGDGKPDYQDTDSDNDGIPDILEKGTGSTPVDTDKDGTPDYRDLDSDGDGIPDAVEKGPDGNNPVDTDGDKIPDYLDVDSDGDGIPDSIEKGADGNNPVDTDGDKIPDYLDLDSDGDGIPDAIEKGADGNNPVDTDGDKIPDYLDLDSDGDGIPDAIEKGADGNNPVDTDGDKIPDYLDLDSDGDGIPDSIEKGPDGTKPVDTDKDGIPDYLDLDSDNDGISDTVEKGADGTKPVDTDKDGIPDYLDLDSDNDGISDTVEKGADGTKPVDTDKDGIPDYLDLDSDNDWIPDTVEKGPDGTKPVDTDKDGIPDYLDLDSDNDGIPDTVEKGPDGTKPVDTDKDGIPDYLDLDSDNDGIPDTVEKGADGTKPVDTDKDGIPDYLDLDSDNDGIPDTVEKGADGTKPVDTDKDGIPDYLDLDSDGDGILDAVEKGPDGTKPVDTDKDGIPDYLDLDSDGDGITDLVESGLNPALDANKDGIVDGTDTDKDGIVDAVDPDNGGTPAPITDTDKDGIPDFREIDSDNDGINDLIEAGIDPKFDTNQDGVFDGADTDGDGLVDAVDPDNGGTPAPVPDTDKDSKPDYQDIDSDNDGILDSIEKGTGATPVDTDGDGTPDFRDLDSDNDGITDLIEGGVKPSLDANGDGKIDSTTDTDSDGLIDAVDPNNGGTAATVPDTDKDGIPDFRETDSDGDGINDLIEGGVNPALDTNGDGKVDGADNDGDGLKDGVDPNNGGTPATVPDTDKDGKPDYQDIDSDNDGIPDVDEKGIGLFPVDTDQDGIPDFRDIDSDNNGIPDGESLLIWKTATKPVLAADGTYSMKYTITVRNERPETINNLQIVEDLTKTFPTPMRFQVTNVTSAGVLTKLASFDGRTNINMLSAGVSLTGKQQDSIIISVKISPNGYTGVVNNTAEGNAVTKWGNVNRQSIDITRSNGRIYGTGLPTLSNLPEVNIFIADVLTPNNDGKNDNWIILKPTNVKAGVTIFNRWGQIVYKNVDYRNDWNGTSQNGFRGNILPGGTYYYVVELSGGKIAGKEVRKGFLTLVK